MGFLTPNIKKLKENRDIKRLIKYLQNKDENVCGEAKQALEEIKDPNTIAPLLYLALDRRWDVHRRALDALEKIDQHWHRNCAAMEMVPNIIKQLEHKDQFVRIRALTVIGKIKDARAVEPLMTCVQNDEWDRMKFDAVWALGEINDPRAIKFLIDLMNHKSACIWYPTLDDSRTYLYQEAEKALTKITGKRLYGQKNWLEWWEKNKTDDSPRTSKGKE